jgi:hypothetical protein
VDRRNNIIKIGVLYHRALVDFLRARLVARSTFKQLPGRKKKRLDWMASPHPRSAPRTPQRSSGPGLAYERVQAVDMVRA